MTWGPTMQGALEAMLAPNLWPTKWKLLEGSMQSNMTGLLCYQNLSEQCAENVPKEASREAGRRCLRETKRQGRRAGTLMLGRWLPLWLPGVHPARPLRPHREEKTHRLLLKGGESAQPLGNLQTFL